MAKILCAARAGKLKKPKKKISFGWGANIDSNTNSKGNEVTLSSPIDHDEEIARPINLKEIFVVREPLSRIISVYYFWGELFKLVQISAKSNGAGGSKMQLGGSKHTADLVTGPLFRYHGNESSIPPIEIAFEFAQRFPYTAGMPGPSYTWSAFANTVNNAVNILKSDRIMTIVTERLDESLIVARHYLNWTIADVVTTAHRKALSTHPKHTEWPQTAIELLTSKIDASGERKVYDAANEKLNERISVLEAKGVNIQQEIVLLKTIRNRVSELCHTQKYLDLYKDYLQEQGLGEHLSQNKLRDTDVKYVSEGHSFSFNGELLYSYDVCGNCEAHALLLGLRKNLASSIETLPTLSQLDRRHLNNNVYFHNCPWKEEPQEPYP